MSCSTARSLEESVSPAGIDPKTFYFSTCNLSVCYLGRPLSPADARLQKRNRSKIEHEPTVSHDANHHCSTLQFVD